MEYIGPYHHTKQEGQAISRMHIKSMGSTEQNTKLLISLMNKAVEEHGISHLLIFGNSIS